jgi:1,2-diacylglycerol 3-alpha-glucosyltransferase
MRIAYYTDTYLPNIDGVVTSIVSSRTQLQKQGHKVYVFASGTKADAIANKDPDVFYYRSATFSPYPQYKVALFPFFSAGRAKRLGVQVVHSHGLATMGLAAMQSAKRLDAPSVATFHTLVTSATHYVSKNQLISSFASKALWRYLKWFFSKFDETIAPSATAQGMLAEHGINSLVVPNGIDTKKFSKPHDPASFRKKFGLEGKRVVLQFGRVAFEKNIDLLIDSALAVKENHPDCAFLVAGRGPDLERVRRRVLQMHLEKSFSFAGYLSREEVADAFAVSDVMAVPSLFETQGLAALEAMSAGVPVAAIKNTAPAEAVLNGKNGFLSDPSPASFADAISRCIGKKGKFSHAAKKQAAEYSLEKCSDKLSGLYASLLEGK